VVHLRALCSSKHDLKILQSVNWSVNSRSNQSEAVAK
jgi:hypothetical protein